MQRRVIQAGGRWNSAKLAWVIHYDRAVALGLKKRILKLEVSAIRHNQAEDNMGQKRKKASYLAEVIYTWHDKFGRMQCARLQSEVKHSYLAVLESLSEADMNSAETIRKLAKLQMHEVFEHFYGEEIPDQLWYALAPSVLEMGKPENLGEAAQLALKLLKYEEEVDNESVKTFSLPPNWELAPTALQPASVRFPVLPKEERARKLRLLFEDLAKLHNIGIGGCELMVSMNEDWQAKHGSEEGHILAYSPACFGFQLATGNGNLVTQIIKGEVSIIEVTIGCEIEQRHTSEDNL